MSPQPTAAPAQKADPAPTPDVPVDDTVKAPPPVDPENLTAPERQIERAHLLEQQRSELMTKVAKNRDYLRLMAGNEELTPEQIAWLNVFYPEKEKGERRSASDIEATRRAREFARQRGTAVAAKPTEAAKEAAK